MILDKQIIILYSNILLAEFSHIILLTVYGIKKLMQYYIDNIYFGWEK